MKYAALLRGIGPGNPNMSNQKLTSVFESLGFQNIQAIISSGNLIFTSTRTNQAELENQIEKALNSQLGIPGRTIIRSQAQLQKLVDAKPFGDLEHSRQSYLLVTFFKRPTKMDFELPYQPVGKPYKILAVIDNSVFTVTDNSAVSTTDLMAWLERRFGKDITSRTRKTVDRILKKLDAIE